MINKLFKHILFSLLCCLFSTAIFAQEKRLIYYNTHEAEILPDARAAFRNGDYERAVQLCEWHYIIVGNKDAELLRERAERCDRFSQTLGELRNDGKIEDARENAELILSINPADANAKEFLLATEKPVSDTLSMSLSEVQDTIKQEIAVLYVQPDTLIIFEPVQDQDENQLLDLPKESVENTPERAPVEKQKTYRIRTRFAVKAGASVLDFKQKIIAPEMSVGLYDIGGSRLGLQVGGYWANLSVTESVYGLDASLAIRLTKRLYQELGIGYIKYSSTISFAQDEDKGLYPKYGLTLRLSEHLCIGLAVKYDPSIYSKKDKIVYDAPGDNAYTITKTILNGGITPIFNIGFAF